MSFRPTVQDLEQSYHHRREPSMSWDVSLHGPDGEHVEVPHFLDGGTLPLGGTTVAELNVTYNYSAPFRSINFHIRQLDGKKARATLETLREGVRMLGTARDRDYWKATDGNAGAALERLLGWAEQHPDATWRVM